MQCPVDGATLMMTERQGVEIDYCPNCRGVWLDRGELDKLVRRDEDEWRGESDRWREGDDDDRERHYDREYGRAPYPRKKKRWLSEMFEFGGD
ncbi:MAG TPA: zf-TFIIB domain-containing protein [Acidimicrobiales bacterium]|nr:zf-TFIIB domain-containing protein [Acidimicrobiales bacterium]